MKFVHILLPLLLSAATFQNANAEDCIPSLDPLCKKEAKKSDDKTLKMDLCRVGADRYYRIGFTEKAAVFIPTTATTFDENLKQARCPQALPEGSDIWVLQPNKPLSKEANANRSHLEAMARRCEKEAGGSTSAMAAGAKTGVKLDTDHKTGEPTVTVPVKK